MLQVKRGFVLSAQVQNAVMRRKLRLSIRDKYAGQGKSLTANTNLVGLMAIKMSFQKVDQNLPDKLTVYGSLPRGKGTQMTKVFTGDKCHIKFLLWALQNVTEYKRDARQD